MQANGNGQSWTRDVFKLDTGPIPVGGCISPSYFAQEVEQIFNRCWLNVGRENEIPRPGDYVLRELPASRTSVIVVRGTDGRIRAFHNVCSHRCNRVVWDERGSCKALHCHFHGWRYALDGRLEFVPDEPEFFDLAKERNGLAPVAVDTWEGFVFVNLDPSPRQTLAEYLGPIHDGVRGYPFDEITRCYAWKLELDCNWKVLKDAFSELYHVPYIHSMTSSDSFVSETHEGTHALAFQVFPHGGQFTVYGNPNHHASPVEEIANRFGSTMLKRGEELRSMPSLFNPSKSDYWAGELLQVFPDFQLSIFPGFYLMHVFRPTSWNHCSWEFRAYYREPETAAQRFSQEYAAVHIRDSVLEDCRTLEYTQLALSSGVKRHFILSDQEVLVRANHLLTQQLAGPYPTVEALQEAR